MSYQRFQTKDNHIVKFIYLFKYFVFAPSQFPYLHQTFGGIVVGFYLADVTTTGSPQVKP